MSLYYVIPTHSFNKEKHYFILSFYMVLEPWLVLELILFFNSHILCWAFFGCHLLLRIFSVGSSPSDLIRRIFSGGPSPIDLFWSPSSLADLLLQAFSDGHFPTAIFSDVFSPADLYRRTFFVGSSSSNIKYIFVTSLVHMTYMLQLEGEY